jgi:peptide/nickel transport system permease protein
MVAYVVRRLALAILLIWLITLLTFVLSAITLGPRIPVAAGNNRPVDIQAICRRMHIEGFVDESCREYPAILRYPAYASALAHGSLGDSFSFHEPVADVLARRVPNTLLLTGTALLLALAGGLALGFKSASSPGSWGDVGGRLLAYFGFSVPAFVVGMLLLLMVFSLERTPLHLHLPFSGIHSTGDSSPGDLALHMLLPVLSLASVQVAYYARFVRSGLKEVLPLDYIRTARAKGLAEHTVLSKHALRSALPPLITVVALSIPGLVSGSILIENIYSWPGIGQVVVQAAATQDQPLVLGVILVVAVTTVLVNLVADVAVAVADPRVRYR